MAVLELTSNIIEAFVQYANLYEYKSISFISRMCRNGHLFIPSSKVAKVFCEVKDPEQSPILNAVMITSGGIVLPLFSDIPPSDYVINDMLKKILNYKKKIFCILGISKDTEFIKYALNYSAYSTINYVFLKENVHTVFEIGKSLFKVKKANKKDSLRLFPLEKAYLMEEVLVGSSEINSQAALLNLRKTCNTQSVFYALSGKEILAKVNTNGQGLGFNQIGGVYTKPEFRNQGVSTQLMKILLNYIHRSGKMAVLYVKDDNQPALTLYTKLGFHIINNYSAHYIKP